MVRKTKTPAKLIVKPAGRPGTQTWTLINELGLEDNKTQYNIIQAYVRRKTQQFCNVSKGILSQHPSVIAQVINKATSKFDHLKNYKNGWPIKEFMRVYLSNCSYQAKITGNVSDVDVSETGRTATNHHSEDDNDSNEDDNDHRVDSDDHSADEDDVEPTRHAERAPRNTAKPQRQVVKARTGKGKGKELATATSKKSKNSTRQAGEGRSPLDRSPPSRTVPHARALSPFAGSLSPPPEHDCAGGDDTLQEESDNQEAEGSPAGRKRTTCPRSEQDTTPPPHIDPPMLGMRKRRVPLLAAVGGNAVAGPSTSEPPTKKAKRVRIAPLEPTKPSGTRQLRKKK